MFPYFSSFEVLIYEWSMLKLMLHIEMIIIVLIII